MGTGNSKKKKEDEEEKDVVYDMDMQPINRRDNRHKSTNPLSLNSDMQPMRRYDRRSKTMTPTNLNKNEQNNFPSLGEKKCFRKSSLKYFQEFKQNYQSGDNNAFLSHLASRAFKSDELTPEEIEVLRKKFIPEKIIDWILEIDEKTGRKTWKKKGKIEFTDKILDEFKKLMNKSIGSSEPFYKKRAWLINFLSKNLSKEKIDDNIKCIIDKKNIFESSFQKFKQIKDIKVNLPMRILFLGEEDKDEGGLNKFWYSSIYKEIFSKERKLFIENTRECLDEKTFLFYPKYPGMNLEHYDFIGKLLLKTFFDRINIRGFNFNVIALKPVLARKITVEDLKYYDINLYKTLKSINDSIIKGNKTFEKYNFTWKIKDENNKEKEVELIENGKNIFLTDENKNQFIEKVIYQECIAPYEEQIKYFHRGIFPILDNNLKGIFSIDELNFLFRGQSEIDIKDWQENTIYKGDYNEEHKVIKMFWDKIKKLKASELSKFLEFSIGAINIPIDGFGSFKGLNRKIQKFTIEPYINYSEEDEKYIFRPMDSRPSFNRLILPEYPNEKEMDKAFNIILKK